MDGPYAESKEMVGGFAIIDVKSRTEAVRLAREFLEVHARILGPTYQIESEVREMYPVGAFDAKQAAPGKTAQGKQAAAAR